MLFDGTSLNDATLYWQLFGSLVYLIVTRLDTAHDVHVVSQFMSAPRSTHNAAVINILRYLKETIFHSLHFSANSSLELHRFSDFDWADDLIDWCSTIGICFFLGDLLCIIRNKLLLLYLLLMLSIRHLLMRLKRLFGFVDY